MGRSLADLNIRIGANIKGLNFKLGKAQKSLRKFQGQTGRIGGAINKNITLPLAALGAVSLRAFDQQAQAIAQVEAGLKSTGSTAGFTSEELQKMASNLQSITTFGDEDILSNVTAQMLTFTNVTGDAFDKAQIAALNLATRLKVDTKSAAIQLGKALNDPIKGINAMSRSGIQFTEDQKIMIKSLTEMGNVAGAQSIILKELENQFGGSAEAAAKAGLGPLKQLKNSLGDISESIGELLLPYVTKMAAKIKTFADRVNSLSDRQKKNIIQIAAWTAGIGLAFTAMSKLAGGVRTIISVGQLLLTANPIGLALSAIVVGFGIAYSKSEKFRGAISGLGAVAAELFKVVKESISGFIGGFEALSNGEFLQAGKLFAESLVKSNPIGIALTQGNRLGDAYMDAYKSKIEKESKEVEVAAPIFGGGGGGSIDIGGLPDIPTTPVGSGVDTEDVRTGADIFADLAENIRLARMESMALGETFGSFKADKLNLVKGAIADMVAIGDEGGINRLSEQYKELKDRGNGLPTTFLAAGESIEELKNKTIESADAITEKLPEIREHIENLTPAMELISEVGESISETLEASFNQLALSGEASFKKLGQAALKGAAQVVRAKIASGIAAVIEDALSKFGVFGIAIGAAAGVAASALFNSALGAIGVPAFAEGGNYLGGLALVGEKGPELINFNSPGYVHTNDELMRAIQPVNGGSMDISVKETRLRGSDLYMAWEVEAARKNRTR